MTDNPLKELCHSYKRLQKKHEELWEYCDELLEEKERVRVEVGDFIARLAEALRETRADLAAVTGAHQPRRQS